MSSQTIELKPLTSAIGAEVRGIDLKKSLDEATVASIKDTFLKYMALFFPDQFIGADELKALLGHFGSISQTRWATHSSEKFGDDPYSHFLRNKDDEPYEETTFTNRAHIDKGAAKYLVKVIGLCALEVPPFGGDTVFTSLYAAYDGLSEPMQKFCESLVGLYSPLRFEQVDEAIKAGPDAVQGLKMREAAVERPLVHTHPDTGRKALYLDNVWTWSIVNLKPEEGAAVLGFLRQHCARPEFQCRFKWRPGDVAIWDNRCTTHQRVPDGFKGDRVLSRASVMATEEVAFIKGNAA